MYQYTFEIGDEWISIFEKNDGWVIEKNAIEKVMTGFVVGNCTQLIVSGTYKDPFDPAASLSEVFTPHFLTKVRERLSPDIKTKGARRNIDILFLVTLPEYTKGVSTAYYKQLKETMDLLGYTVKNVGCPYCVQWFSDFKDAPFTPAPIRGSHEVAWGSKKPSWLENTPLVKDALSVMEELLNVDFKKLLGPSLKEGHKDDIMLKTSLVVVSKPTFELSCVVNIGCILGKKGPTINKFNHEDASKLDNALRTMERVYLQAPRNNIYDITVTKFVIWFDDIGDKNEDNSFFIVAKDHAIPHNYLGQIAHCKRYFDDIVREREEKKK